MLCNYTNSTHAPLDESLKLFKLVAYIPVFALGLVFNVLALWVFCCKLKKWTETRLYMLNLVVSDCSLLFTLPFRLYSYRHRWDLGKGLCDCLKTIYRVNMYMSIFTITLIAVSRYIAIKHPLKAKWWRSPRRAVLACALLWMVSISFSVSRVFISKDKEFTSCFKKIITSRAMKFDMLYIAIGFFLPFLIVSFCSAQIIRTLKRKANPSAHEEQTVKKAIRIITANLIVFTVCFLPLHLGYVARFIAKSIDAACHVRQHIHTYVHIAAYIANCNCFLDAICYYFVAKEFREASVLSTSSRSTDVVKFHSQEK